MTNRLTVPSLPMDCSPVVEDSYNRAVIHLQHGLEKLGKEKQLDGVSTNITPPENKSANEHLSLAIDYFADAAIETSDNQFNDALGHLCNDIWEIRNESHLNR